VPVNYLRLVWSLHLQRYTAVTEGLPGGLSLKNKSKGQIISKEQGIFFKKINSREQEISLKKTKIKKKTRKNIGNNENFK